ncbi:MAG: hypothetical protein HY962_07140 [Ignavibacteriae bacterium]|nr:hypothetical protein [Ignavibacteriota bacterium]
MRQRLLYALIGALLSGAAVYVGQSGCDNPPATGLPAGAYSVASQTRAEINIDSIRAELEVELRAELRPEVRYVRIREPRGSDSPAVADSSIVDTGVVAQATMHAEGSAALAERDSYIRELHDRIDQSERIRDIIAVAEISQPDSVRGGRFSAHLEFSMRDVEFRNVAISYEAPADPWYSSVSEYLPYVAAVMGVVKLTYDIIK